MKHARISGYLILITGVLHILLALVEGYPQFIEMARDGLINTVTVSSEREVAFWFLVTGVGFFLTGLLALGYERPLPASFGWGLLGLSLVATFLIPFSGFPLLVPQALYILVMSRRSARQNESDTDARNKRRYPS
jgi:hypothetical protein